MKKISEIVTPSTVSSVISNTASTNNKNPAKPEYMSGMTNDEIRQTNQVVNQLFSELIVIFPAWSTATKFQDQDQWSANYKKLLRKLFIERNINSAEQLAKGLAVAEKMSGDGQVFLPPANQFVGWCLKSKVPYHQFFDEPTAEERKQIEQQRSTPETFSKNIAAMRAMLGKK